MAYRELNEDGSVKEKKQNKVRTKNDLDLLRLIVEGDKQLQVQVMRVLEIALGKVEAPEPLNTRRNRK